VGLGVSIFLIALGAILTFAVNTSPSGLNIHVVGVILMCVGILGILLSLIYWESWGRGGYGRGYAPPPGDYPARSGWYARGYRPRTRVVEEVVDESPPPPGPPAGPPPP
jgi:hypothetical protein